MWVVAAALFVGWAWALVAAAAAAVLVVGLGRPRLAGLVTLGIVAVIGAVIVWVVHDERPLPDAGWPSRFEWLHGLGLFAAVRPRRELGDGFAAGPATPMKPSA